MTNGTDNFERLVNIRLRNTLRNMQVSLDRIGIPPGSSLSEENAILRKALESRGSPVAITPTRVTPPAVAPTAAPATGPVAFPPIAATPPRTSPLAPRTSPRPTTQPTERLGWVPDPIKGAAGQFAREATRGGITLMEMLSLGSPLSKSNYWEGVRGKLPEYLKYREPTGAGAGTGALLADLATLGLSYLPTKTEWGEDPKGSAIRAATVAGGLAAGPLLKAGWKAARPVVAPALARHIAPTIKPLARKITERPRSWISKRPARGQDPQEVARMAGKSVDEPKDPRSYIPLTSDGTEVRSQTIFRRNNLRKIGEFIERQPYLGATVRLLNPSTAVRNAGAKAKVLYFNMWADQNAERKFHMFRLGAAIAPRGGAKLFDIKNGRVAVPGGIHGEWAGSFPAPTSRVALGDAFENPVKYFGQNSEQTRWIQDASGLIDEALANFEKESGQKIGTELLSRENYWPRFVTNRPGELFERKGNKLLKPTSSVKKRLFESMEEGMEKNVNYLDDPLKTVDLYLKNIEKATRDEILKKRLVQGGIIKKLRKGEVLGEGQAQIQAFARQHKMHRPWVVTKDHVGKGVEKELDQIVDKSHAFLNGIERTGGLARFIATGTLDMAQFTLQLAPMLFYSPRRWANTVKTGAKTFVDPEYLARDIAANPEQYRLYSRYGGNVGDVSELVRESRLVEQIGSGRLGQIPGAGVIARGMSSYARRFSASFNASLTKGKAEMFEAMHGSVRKRVERNGIRSADGRILRVGDAGFEEAVDKELRRLNRAVETMLGTTESATLGISANQRSIESGLLFFSPRYTRSVFGTVAHAFGNGATNREVQELLAKFLGGGVITYIGLAQAHARATGDDFDKTLSDGLDPRSGKKFLSLPIGDQWVGIGGAYRSASQLLANLVAIESLGLAKEGRPAWDFDKTGRGGTVDQAFFENPITKYLRSRSSPIGGTLMDLLDGEDFIGRPMPGIAPEDWPALGEYLLRKTSPFSAQAIVETLGAPDPEETDTSVKIAKALGVGTIEALAGMRTSPQTWYDRADDMAQEALGESFRNLEAYQKAEIKQDPGIHKMMRETESFGYWKESTRLDLEQEDEINALVKEASLRYIPGIGASYSSKFKSYIRNKYYDIQSKYANKKDELQNIHGIDFDDEPEGIHEQDMDAYYAVYDNLRPGQSYDDGIKQLKYRMISEPDGFNRWQYVLRNMYLKPIPPSIFNVLSPASRRRRLETQAARKRHKAGR